MGIMTGAGSLSRVLGPVFVGSIYTRLGTNWTFGVTSVMMALSMIWLIAYNSDLLPPTVADNGASGAGACTEMRPIEAWANKGDANGTDANGQDEKLLKSDDDCKETNDAKS